MANACAVRDPGDDRQKAVYEVEQLWYQGSHPLNSFEDHLEMIHAHKSHLGKFRGRTAQNLVTLDACHTNITSDDIFSESNMAASLAFVGTVFEMSKQCSSDFVALSRYIIQSSIDLIGAPPCPLAVIGLGSIARGEATPFSDLEYAFIVKHDDEYFTKLAVDSYFRIANLGESPLKCFNIKELYCKDGKGNRQSFFIDKPPVNGFKIDGISKKAGNIPTGNRLPDGKRLILSVDELMEVYKSSLEEEPDPSKPGDMADLLSSSVLILSYQNGDELYKDFIRKRQVYEKDKASVSLHARNKRLLTIKSDIENHSFIPEFEFGGVKHTQIQVKADIFRYPTLLATNLRIILELDCQYPWQVLDTLLRSNRILSEHNHKCMLIALGLSIYIRTNAYTKLGSQKELLSLYPKVDQPIQNDDRYYIPRNIFAVLGCLLIPIKDSLSKSLIRAQSALKNLGATFVLSGFMQDIVRQFQVSPSDFLLKAEVLSFMGDSKVALKVISNFGGIEVLEDGEKFIELVRSVYSTNKYDKLEKKALMVCASLLAGDLNHKGLLDFSTWLITYSQTPFEIAHWQRNAAECMVKLEKHMGAISVLKQVLASLYSGYSLDGTVSLVDHVISLVLREENETDSHAINMGKFVSNVYSLFGRAKVGLHGKKETKKEGQIAEALDDLRQSVKILHTLRDKKIEVRPDLAFIYDHMAKCYRDLDQQVDALEINLKFLELSESLYGLNAVHRDFVQFYNNIGNICSRLGENDLGNLYHNHAIDIHNQTVDQENTRSYRLSKPARDVEHLSDTYHLIAVGHHQNGNHQEALKYHKQALAMRCQRSGPKGKEHPRVAMSHTYIGELYLNMGDLCEANRHHQLALEVLHRIHGSRAENTDIASCHEAKGKVYCEMGQYDDSLKQYKKALAMRTSLAEGKDNNKHSAAFSLLLRRIGTVFHSMGNLNLSMDYFSASMTLSNSKNATTHASLLVCVSEAWMSSNKFRTAIQFAKTALNSVQNEHGRPQPLIVSHAYHIVGHCFMMEDKDKYRSKAYQFLNLAREVLQEVHVSSPVNFLSAKVYYSLSLWYFKFRLFREAKATIDKCLAKCSNISSGWKVVGPECTNIMREASSLAAILGLVSDSNQLG